MKKVFSIVLLLCFAAFAQTSSVVVTGSGATEAEAKNNAFVAAIEQAIGVMVSSDVLVENGELIEERIRARSDGFIKSYAVLNSSGSDGAYNVTIRAEVSQEALTKELEIITGTKVDIDGASAAASVATKQKLYEQLVEDFPERGAELVQMLLASYEMSITGVEFDHEAVGWLNIPFAVTVRFNVNSTLRDNALSEIDKTFIALGAAQHQMDSSDERNIVKVELEHGGYQYIFSEKNYRLVEKYFLNKLDDYGRKIVLNITADGKVMTYTYDLGENLLFKPSYTWASSGMVDTLRTLGTLGRSIWNSTLFMPYSSRYTIQGEIGKSKVELITSIEASFPK